MGESVEFRAIRGTERASLTGATEGCLLLAAALETVLLAGFALLATHAGRGSVTADTFMRLNTLLIKPVGLLPFFAAPLGRQIAAILIYGAILSAVAAAVAWLDRRQALGY